MDILSVVNFHIYSMWINESVKLKTLPFCKYMYMCLEMSLIKAGKFGQLTYMRVYQGGMKKGDTIFNTRNNKKVRVSRLVRMNADEMEVINQSSELFSSIVCYKFLYIHVYIDMCMHKYM